MKIERLSGLLKAISHPPRLRLLYLLEELGRDLCVCELVDALQVPQYQVSRQLGELRDHGIVDGDRDGTWVYYSLNDNLDKSVKEVIKAIVESLDEEEFREDIKGIKERLKKREDGKCVVGYKEDED